MAEAMGMEWEGDYLEGYGGQKAQKLFFDQMAAPAPEIMDGSLYMLQWCGVRRYVV
jgi:hypothetical protein